MGVGGRDWQPCNWGFLGLNQSTVLSFGYGCREVGEDPSSYDRGYERIGNILNFQKQKEALTLRNKKKYNKIKSTVPIQKMFTLNNRQGHSDSINFNSMKNRNCKWQNCNVLPGFGFIDNLKAYSCL